MTVKRERRDPWLELPRREANIMRDLAQTLHCYSQQRDGWYTPSCYESRARRACTNCNILKRLHRLLKERHG